MGQWDKIVGTYAAFGLAVTIAMVFVRGVRPERAVKVLAFTYVGALTFLPAAAYDVIMEDVVVPTWYIGALIPSPYIAIDKAWVAALAALVIGLRLDWRRFAAFRPGLIDVPIALFCLLPFAQLLVVQEAPAPSTLITFLLLAGCWGLPWLLGRVWLSDRAGRTALADALVLFTLLLLPIAVIEGLGQPRVHAMIYGPHPFALDGVGRAVGFRPLAFFEHGNQYGIWLAAAAFAGWWRARHARRGDSPGLRWIAAFMLVLMTLAAQSYGAIALLFLAILWLEFAPLLDRFPWLWRIGFGGLLFIAATLAMQLHAGAKTGYEAQPLRMLTGMFGDMHRQSLVWRMDRALDSLEVIKAQLTFGYARWDWYSKGSFRPWDLTLMLVGHFGLVGLCLIILTLVSAMILRRRDLAGAPGSARHLALGVAGIAIADALMNTYVFYPALVMLGALATSPLRPSPRVSPDRLREADRRAVGPEPSWLDRAPAATRPGQKI
jgi:hypothetical protein